MYYHFNMDPSTVLWLCVSQPAPPGSSPWRSWWRRPKGSPTWRWPTKSWSTRGFRSNRQRFRKAGECFHSERRPGSLFVLFLFFLPQRSKVLLCLSKQFGAQGEGDHAQSILGLLGGSVKGRSTDLYTRHQAAGWDQRGAVKLLITAVDFLLISSFLGGGGNFLLLFPLITPFNF